MIQYIKEFNQLFSVFADVIICIYGICKAIEFSNKIFNNSQQNNQ